MSRYSWRALVELRNYINDNFDTFLSAVEDADSTLSRGAIVRPKSVKIGERFFLQNAPHIFIYCPTVSVPRSGQRHREFAYECRITGVALAGRTDSKSGGYDAMEILYRDLCFWRDTFLEMFSDNVGETLNNKVNAVIINNFQIGEANEGSEEEYYLALDGSVTIRLKEKTPNGI